MPSDPRMKRMASIIAEHSLAVRPGEKVLIDALDECEDLIIAAVDAISAAGGLPYVLHQTSRVRRTWLRSATDAGFALWYESVASVRREMDCLLTIRGQDNASELADVPPEAIRKFGSWGIKLMLETRKPGFRSTLIRFPSRSLAQQSGMSTEAFEDHFFRACAMNFKVLHREMEPLKAALDAAGMVRILAPGTDLSLSIEGIQGGISAGTWNIPDGEVSMSVVRESVNGRIAYNIPSSHLGFVFRDIALTFRDGRVVRVEANDAPRMEAILDTDEGARYIGEFAIGVNPYLRRHIIDTLFDEKMAGSLHVTPSGTDSQGRRSLVHWDIVQCHLPGYGGGEIFLDGTLWRKNGMFVGEGMQRLNPDALGAILDAADGSPPHA